jgi:hypothetical protein
VGSEEDSEQEGEHGLEELRAFTCYLDSLMAQFGETQKVNFHTAHMTGSHEC